jgi:hypothetical protein
LVHRDEPSAAQVVPQKIPLVPLVPPLHLHARRHINVIQSVHFMANDRSNVHTLDICNADGKGTTFEPSVWHDNSYRTRKTSTL